MPDDSTNNQTNNSSNNSSNDSSNDSSNNQSGGGQVVIGCDHNNGEDKAYQDGVAKVLENGGYQVEKLPIGPNHFASYSYSSNAQGKKGVFIIAAGLTSIVDLYYGNTNFDFAVFGVRQHLNGIDSQEDMNTKPISPDRHGDCLPAANCQKLAGKTYKEINEITKDKCVTVTGGNPEELGQNILAALGGGAVGGGSTGSGGAAQIKDKTFEKCIRRICAATDSVFLVENNAAVLFPYTDWMAFTLRQKINTIKSNEIDPDVFSMEYGNDGFYNKVTIAWGGTTLPDRYKTDENGKQSLIKQVSNYTINDITKNMSQTQFNYDTWLKTQQELAKNKTTKNKKGNTTETITENTDGSLLLSEQYDSLVEKYGEQEKRVESSAPDYETAQYIINALLIQYIRDYNNMCKCRALANRKYIGGTFYAVENPFTKESELFYLNGYTLRIQKHAPMYHDLDFKYGPEGAEELLEYQYLQGGAASGGAASTGGSATEDEIWERAKVPCHQWTCPQLREPESDTQDPKTAEDYYNKMADSGKKFCLTCYGMSAFLHYEFNQKAGIACQVVGDSTHHVVMIDRGDGKGMVETRQEYRQLDQGFRWKTNQPTTVLLPATAGGSNNGTSSSGNTQSSNANGGNR